MAVETVQSYLSQEEKLDAHSQVVVSLYSFELSFSRVDSPRPRPDLNDYNVVEDLGCAYAEDDQRQDHHRDAELAHEKPTVEREEERTVDVFKKR